MLQPVLSGQTRRCDDRDWEYFSEKVVRQHSDDLIVEPVQFGAWVTQQRESVLVEVARAVPLHLDHEAIVALLFIPGNLWKQPLHAITASFFDIKVGQEDVTDVCASPPLGLQPLPFLLRHNGAIELHFILPRAFCRQGRLNSNLCVWLLLRRHDFLDL